MKQNLNLIKKSTYIILLGTILIIMNSCDAQSMALIAQSLQEYNQQQAAANQNYNNTLQNNQQQQQYNQNLQQQQQQQLQQQQQQQERNENSTQKMQREKEAQQIISLGNSLASQSSDLNKAQALRLKATSLANKIRIGELSYLQAQTQLRNM